MKLLYFGKFENFEISRAQVKQRTVGFEGVEMDEFRERASGSATSSLRSVQFSKVAAEAVPDLAKIKFSQNFTTFLEMDWPPAIILAFSYCRQNSVRICVFCRLLLSILYPLRLLLSLLYPLRLLRSIDAKKKKAENNAIQNLAKIQQTSRKIAKILAKNRKLLEKLSLEFISHMSYA